MFLRAETTQNVVNCFYPWDGKGGFYSMLRYSISFHFISSPGPSLNPSPSSSLFYSI